MKPIPAHSTLENEGSRFQVPGMSERCSPSTVGLGARRGSGSSSPRSAPPLDLPIHPPTHPSTHPFIHQFIHSSTHHPPISISIYIYIHIYICIYISPPAAERVPPPLGPQPAAPPLAAPPGPQCRRRRRRLLYTACTSVALRRLALAVEPTLHPACCGRRQGHRLRLQSEVRRITSHLTVSGVLTGTPRSPPCEPASCGADSHGADDFATQPPLGGPPAATEGGAQQVCEELAKLERALRPARTVPPPVEACPSVSHTRASVADELSRISLFLQASSPLS